MPPMRDLSFTGERGNRLAASFWAAGDQDIVVFAHGFMSDRSSRGRTPQIATHLHQAGYSVLSLDFAGSGTSDDEPLLISHQVADLRVVLHTLRQRGFERIALWGHSMGARIALEAGDEGIVTLISVGGVTGPVPFDPATRFNQAQLSQLADTGVITEHREGPRQRIVVDRKLFSEFNSELNYGNLNCPVLCVHGDADDTERGLLSVTRDNLNRLPCGSSLEVLEGADHTFMTHLADLINLGQGWLLQHMPLPGPE